MAKLLILAALLILSSKTEVSSTGTTTSPQQQNPKTGADKDPCEVHLSMLYPRLYNTISLVLHDVFICYTSVYHSVYQAKRKTNPSPIISLQRQSRVLLQRYDHSMFRAVSPKTKLNSQRD